MSILSRRRSSRGRDKVNVDALTIRGRVKEEVEKPIAWFVLVSVGDREVALQVPEGAAPDRVRLQLRGQVGDGDRGVNVREASKGPVNVAARVAGLGRGKRELHLVTGGRDRARHDRRLEPAGGRERCTHVLKEPLVREPSDGEVRDVVGGEILD